jgi:hypothetical protein
VIKISIEGQTLELPPEIAVSDDAIRRAMAPVFPQIATAYLTRTTDASGTTVIKVTKRANDKGALDAVLHHLKEAPRHVNPIFPLYERLYLSTGRLPSAEDFFTIQRQLRKAIEDGEAEINDVSIIRARLRETAGTPSRSIPVGF